MVVTWPIRLRVCDLVVCYMGSAARFLCRVLWVSTRRGTLVFATTLVVLEYPDLHTINDVLYLSYRKAVSQTESLKPHGARHCPART